MERFINESTKMHSSIKQEYYLKGVEDGKKKSIEDSLESGFRDGVTYGVDYGYHLSFIETIKQLIEKDARNMSQYKSKLDKIKSSIKAKNIEDIDILKGKVKQIKTNMMLIYNKN